MNNLKQARQQL